MKKDDIAAYSKTILSQLVIGFVLAQLFAFITRLIGPSEQSFGITVIIAFVFYIASCYVFYYFMKEMRTSMKKTSKP